MWDVAGGPSSGLASALSGGAGMGESSLPPPHGLWVTLTRASIFHQPRAQQWHKWLLDMKGSIQGIK